MAELTSYVAKDQVLIKTSLPKDTEYTESALPSFFALVVVVMGIIISLLVYSAIPMLYKISPRMKATSVIVCSYMVLVLMTSLVVLPALWKMLSAKHSRSKRRILTTVKRSISLISLLIAPVQLCLSVANPSISILIALYLYPSLLFPLSEGRVIHILLACFTNPLIMIFISLLPFGFERFSNSLHEHLFIHRVFDSQLPLFFITFLTSTSITTIFCQYMRLLTFHKVKTE